MLRFSQVDVFTDELTSGNPVAVVHDGDRLTDEQMARFARWTNLSETTFLLSPTEPHADYRVRIFTPRGELGFAGHPTLGSARAWLAAGGVPHQEAELLQQCSAGLIRVRRHGDRLAFAAPPLVRSGPLTLAELADIARALRVDDDAIRDAAWVDNGPGWVAVLLPDAQFALDLEPDLSVQRSFQKVGVVGPHPGDSEIAFEVRAFVAGGGLGEDPVTGSLNAGIAQWLIPAGHAPSSYVAAQGTRLGRRGRLYVQHADGDIWVGGHTVLGVEGTVAL